MCMNYVKKLITEREIKEFSKDIIGDTIEAVLGDEAAALRVSKSICKFPILIRDKIFWTKISEFMNGVFLDEGDRAKLRARLTENGEKGDNPLRLIECIDRAETQKKISYLINATRCLLADFIDLDHYFRICHAITHTLEEDLSFLRDHINEDNLSYNNCVQGLFTAGLMYQSIIGGNGDDRYSFTPVAKLVDRYAISYDNVSKYPNPIKGVEENVAPSTTVNGMVRAEIVTWDDE